MQKICWTKIDAYKTCSLFVPLKGKNNLCTLPHYARNGTHVNIFISKVHPFLQLALFAVENATAFNTTATTGLCAQNDWCKQKAQAVRLRRAIVIDFLNQRIA